MRSAEKHQDATPRFLSLLQSSMPTYDFVVTPEDCVNNNNAPVVKSIAFMQSLSFILTSSGGIGDFNNGGFGGGGGAIGVTDLDATALTAMRQAGYDLLFIMLRAPGAGDGKNYVFCGEEVYGGVSGATVWNGQNGVDGGGGGSFGANDFSPSWSLCWDGGAGAEGSEDGWGGGGGGSSGDDPIDGQGQSGDAEQGGAGGLGVYAAGVAGTNGQTSGGYSGGDGGGYAVAMFDPTPMLPVVSPDQVLVNNTIQVLEGANFVVSFVNGPAGYEDFLLQWGDSWTWGLGGADAALFQIDSAGVLEFIDPAVPGSYEVGVYCANSEGQSDPYNLQVVVTTGGSPGAGRMLTILRMMKWL